MYSNGLHYLTVAGGNPECKSCTLYKKANPPTLDGGSVEIYPQCKNINGDYLIVSRYPLNFIPVDARCSPDYDRE